MQIDDPHKGRRAGPPNESVGRSDVTSKERELVKQFSIDYARSADAFKQMREMWKRYQRAYSGQPFDPEVVKELRDTNRILANFNYSLSTINTLIGQDQADRKEATFKGIDDSEHDAFAAELMTDAVRHLYLRAKGHRKESVAQLDQLVCGYGWLEVFMDTSTYPFKLSTRHVDLHKMYVDPRYEEDNCGDARYVVYSDDWSVEQAIARFPKMEAKIRAFVRVSSSGGSERPKKSTGDAYGYNKGPSDTSLRADERQTRVRVSNYQYKVSEPWVGFTHPTTGMDVKLPRKDFEALVAELAAQPDPEMGSTMAEGIEGVDFVNTAVYSCWFVGVSEDALLVEEPKRFEDELFTYRCATAYRGRNPENGYTYHFGLMTLIYEPQLWATKTISSILDFIARQNKGGGFVKPDILMNPGGFQRDSAKPGFWHFVKPEADLSRDIMHNPSMQWPQALEKILDFCIESMPRLSNVTEWNKGTAVTERSNVLITNLQQHSQMVLNPLFDPLSQLRVEVAMLFARFLQRYVPASVIDRILGQRKCKGVTYDEQPDPTTGAMVEVPKMVAVEGGAIDPATGQPMQRPVMPSDIIKNMDVTLYDVEVDLGNASVTAKQAFIQAIMQTAFGQTLAEHGLLMRFMPLIVKAMPSIPANEAKKLSDEFEFDAQVERSQRNPAMLMQAISKLPPDQMATLQQQLQALLQQMMMQNQAAGAAPAEPSAPPQGG